MMNRLTAQFIIIRLFWNDNVGEFYSDLNYDNNKFRKNYNPNKGQSAALKMIYVVITSKMGHCNVIGSPFKVFGILQFKLGLPLKYLMIRRRR
jgi:uncharacterized membrane protein YkvI